jgi:hypothetical protein
VLSEAPSKPQGYLWVVHRGKAQVSKDRSGDDQHVETFPHILGGKTGSAFDRIHRGRFHVDDHNVRMKSQTHGWLHDAVWNHVEKHFPDHEIHDETGPLDQY